MTTLGIDYGTKRIGIALSDECDTIATPLTICIRRSLENDLERIATLASEHDADLLVVGLPLNMNGSEGPSAQAARQFAGELARASGRNVEMFDERLTTVSAEGAMIQAGLSRADRKKRLDKVAAQMILQAYLDAHRSDANDG